MKTIALIIIAALYAPSAMACYERAAAAYGLEPELVLAVAWMESRWNPKAININTNGSEDLCAMQINDQHLKRLGQYGITRDLLLTDLCTCAYTGAWILATEIRRENSIWKGVASYHTGPAGNPERRAWYANSVKGIYEALKRGAK